MFKSLQVHVPRALLLWWSGWLLCSWALAFGLRWWLAPSTTTFSTASQRLLFNAMIGITIVWPMYRVVGRTLAAARLLTLMDWLTIFVTFQVALWPLRIPAQWPASRVLLIDATVGAWALLVAAIIALATHLIHPWARAAGMGACLMLTAAAPTIALMRGLSDGDVNRDWYAWSPLSGVWRASGLQRLDAPGQEWLRIAIILAVAVLAWVGVMLMPRPGSVKNPLPQSS